MNFTPIERRSAAELSYRDFLADYAIPRKPLILTGAADGWGARERWTWEALQTRPRRDEEVDVLLYEAGTARFTSQRIRLGELLDTMQQRLAGAREDSRRYYLSNWYFWRENPEMLEDCFVPRYAACDCSSDFGFPPASLRWLFVGEGDFYYPTHVDVASSPAWLYLVCGEKKFRCVPREQAALVGGVKDYVMGVTQGQYMDLFAPDRERFPGADQIQGFEGVVRPGEVMFVPAGVPHTVWTTGFSIAMTGNYIDLTSALEAAASEAVRVNAERAGLVQEEMVRDGVRSMLRLLEREPEARAVQARYLTEQGEARLAELRRRLEGLGRFAGDGRLQRLMAAKLGGQAEQRRGEDVKRSIAALEEALRELRTVGETR